MSKEGQNFGFSVVMLAVVALVIVGVMKMMGSVLNGEAVADMGAEAVAERIKPVGSVNTGAPIVAAQAPAAAPAAASAARSGEQVYNSACMACHSTGVAGAPKLGDKAAWAPRAAQGMDTLMSHATNGLNAMPPRGTCGTCSDAELKAAVEYMVKNSK